jgi:hypothetical protein
MKSVVLILSILLAVCGYGQDQTHQQPIASSDSNVEQVQFQVPAGREEAETKRVEQLVNHLGGKVLSSSKTTGGSELLARIPAENVSYFRENVRGSSGQSTSAQASADQIFRVVIQAH